MHIVLLSGGSGKRLWPLSNDTRSKQFLQLLNNEHGEKESMVQRVVRQITESNLTSSLIIATSESQLGSIKNQLGNKVDVVIEPERRDTFPAIALSSAYLAFEKGVGNDEVVVVMPCDTFTESSYFDTIKEMVAVVEADKADLVLMGVTPTYPSTKYGYVVPTEDLFSTYHIVQRFTEKPNEEIAKLLLSQNAFWNGGVFAFRLGYLMNIVNKYIQSSLFCDLRNNYTQLPKISFDYEVVEKASSIAVVPFTGIWNDLGTWNALAEEIETTSLGNVTIGTDVVNTTIINELSIPIICDGIDNSIVVAGYDGILVASKESSENIKQYANAFGNCPMYEEHCWGTYCILDKCRYISGEGSLIKKITIKPGCNLPYEKHDHRSEVWTIVDGEGLIVIDEKQIKVTAGNSVIIPIKHYHSIRAITEVTLIEVQTGHYLVKEDFKRAEWFWDK